jgi:hypothetical protein
MASDLVIQFADIFENPTIFPDEQGQLDIVVKNEGNTRFQGPINLKLYASTDKVLELNSLNTLGSVRGASDLLQGKDELLGSLNSLNVNLRPGQSRTFTIDFAGSDFRTASVVSPGLYYLVGQVESANSNIAESNTNNNLATQIITEGDVVIQWNSILLNAIQLAQTAPPLGARNQAIVHAAIYDAVNAIDRSYKPYLVNISASEAAGASKEAAAVEAAYQTLVTVFTDPQFAPPRFFLNQGIRDTLKATFDEQRQRSLAAIPDGAAEDKGIAIGQQVARQILDSRRNDGAITAQGAYTPGNRLGDWQPTFSDGETTNNTTNLAPALLPQWGLVKPFAINSVAQFRPDTLPQYGSPRYAREFNRVKAIGSENSTVRTKDQTEIAQFWAYDRGDTFRPPGQLNELAQEVALAQGNTLEENARLFALLNIAQADAGISAWDTKYSFNQARPITVIRNGDRDNNPNTVSDPNWEPLLDTPAFPDYISGHSVFGGVSAEILKLFYGTDNISFDIPSQELPGVARYFNSFSQVAQEDADSRLYGGVHIDSATVDGVQVGKNVGTFVFNNYLTPV